MSVSGKKQHNARFVIVYELLIWFLYVVIYKYGSLVERDDLPRMRMNFPFPQLMLYAVATTVYVIPFYRWLGPWLLQKKQYGRLLLATLVYFLFIPKWCNWLVTFVFKEWDSSAALALFYQHQFNWYTQALFTRMLEVQVLLFDLLAFFSVLFVRYAFENELKRIAVEKDNLQLQLETLKAQLHPHFLFNTLNSIYGMSLTGAPETPDFILRLSDMMRYVLYDCRTNEVTLEKDLAFLGNYLEMEKKRYPQAAIDFAVEANGAEQKIIAPLLLIPFLENSFKHGAHRIADSGFIKGRLTVTGNQLDFTLVNSALVNTAPRRNHYGGVGIVNVQKRLELYYPSRHSLEITAADGLYNVHLSIQL